MDDQTAFDIQVRREVYDACMRKGYPPAVVEIAAALAAPEGQVREALGRLATGRVMVLQPNSGEVLDGKSFFGRADAFPGGACIVFLLRQLHLGCSGHSCYASPGRPH